MRFDRRPIIIGHFVMAWLVLPVCFQQAHGNPEIAVPEHPYFQQKAPDRKADPNQWEKLTRDLDYSTDAVQPYQAQPLPVQPDQPGSETSHQTLLILIIVSLLVWMIFKLARKEMFSRRTAEQTARSGSILPVEKESPEVTDEAYRNAIRSKDYKLAIRISYIKLIRLLSKQRHIQWSKDKTNQHYLKEMKSHPQYELFSTLTASFENIYYGSQKPEEQDFQQWSGRINGLVNGLTDKHS